MPFQRIAIVNRGEPAMRFLNAVAELNGAGGDRLTTIALYTEPDRRSVIKRQGDDDLHYTGGLGVVLLESRFQIDVAANISDNATEYLVSSIFRFGS